MKFLLKLSLFFLALYLILNYLEKDYSALVEELDLQIKNFASSFGLSNANLKFKLRQIKYQGKKKIPYWGRAYFISQDFPLPQFEESLSSFLKKRRFKMKKELFGPEQARRYEIFYKALNLYTLTLEKKIKGNLAIVIDDWGYSPELITYLKEIKIPLNIAILPLLAYSQTVAKIAEQQGHEILLHLPMQPLPKEKIEKQLEKITLKENMEGKEIRSILEKFLNNLISVKGVNNHMGSLISKNEKMLKALLQELKRKGLYYLDSKVIPDSLAPAVAEKVGIKCFQRDIFIDNQREPAYIKGQIRKAMRLANKNGSAILIGHAKRDTLEVIRDMVPEIMESTSPARLSELK